MKKVENDTREYLAEVPNPEGDTTNQIGLYQKCLNCQDYGVSCNGPKLAALGDIMIVREFHRAIKTARKITLKDIANAAPSISEYTVQDYFSHSVKDFKWTTVGVIDNALTAICGNRVGEPLLDNPCPAASSDIQQQLAGKDAVISDLKAECSELRQQLQIARAEDRIKIDHLIAQLKQSEKTAERRYKLIVNRDWIIIGLAILCVFLLILATMYLAWDFTHDGAGIFW